MAFPYSSGDVLTAADLNASSGLVLVKSQTIGSGVSSVIVTGAFSSTFENYKIVISGGVAANNTLLEFQLGSTTTSYYWSYLYGSWAGGTGQLRASNASRFGRVGYGTPDTLHVEMELFNPYLAKRTLMRSTYIAPITTGDGGGVTGYLDNATSYTEFTIISVQNLTGGTIRVYGYNNG